MAMEYSNGPMMKGNVIDIIIAMKVNGKKI